MAQNVAENIDDLMKYCTRVHITALRLLATFFNTCSCSELFFLKIRNNTNLACHRAPFSTEPPQLANRTLPSCAGIRRTASARPRLAGPGDASSNCHRLLMLAGVVQDTLEAYMTAVMGSLPSPVPPKEPKKLRSPPRAGLVLFWLGLLMGSGLSLWIWAPPSAAADLPGGPRCLDFPEPG